MASGLGGAGSGIPKSKEDIFFYNNDETLIKKAFIILPVGLNGLSTPSFSQNCTV